MTSRFLLACIVISTMATGQSRITGQISGEEGPLAGVNIQVGSYAGSSDQNGRYIIDLNGSVDDILMFTYVGYDTLRVQVRVADGQTELLDVKLVRATTILEQVEISTDRQEAGVVTISPRAINTIPSVFGDFNRVLATLPGVVTANELSSAYSVRGGNYDENLVYVNGFEVYRPFLIRAGRQEGLSFIHPSLVSATRFYAGGWPANFGNKLASVLDVTYRKPTSTSGSIGVGLLGGEAHLEGSSKRFSYLMGARHKRAEYLFNTFEVDGEYRPNFSDIQGYFNLDVGREHPEKTQLGLLVSYAANRYKVTPTARESEFGSFNNAFRFLVAFEGTERLDYDTWQAGVNLRHQQSEKVVLHTTISAVRTFEREYSEVEGGYRLCDIDKNPGSSTFNECISIRGIGTNYFHARNTLEGTLLSTDASAQINTGSGVVSTGLFYDYQYFDDYLEEFRFIDSANYVSVSDRVAAVSQTTAQEVGAFAQQELDWGSNTLSYGMRLTFRNTSEQWLVSPRFSFSRRTSARDFTWKLAAGLFQQNPLYREMRDYNGQVNEAIQAQQSVHLSWGLDKGFSFWSRPFRWTGEIYGRYLWDVVPYEVDNVRIRYLGENAATAYAVGFDTRIGGEFIPGAESWFSLGLLSTQERLNEDGEWLRRPTDQRVTFSAFFEDHLPNNPTMRVNLSLVYGSGLPFGPPGNFETRTVFQGPVYNRVDIGFSKIFLVKQSWQKSIWLRVEILNLLGAANTISYTWIQDVSSQFIAVPNTLSNRFFNVKLAYRFGDSFTTYQ